MNLHKHNLERRMRSFVKYVLKLSIRSWLFTRLTNANTYRKLPVGFIMSDIRRYTWQGYVYLERQGQRIRPNIDLVTNSKIKNWPTTNLQSFYLIKMGLKMIYLGNNDLSSLKYEVVGKFDILLLNIFFLIAKQC